MCGRYSERGRLEAGTDVVFGNSTSVLVVERLKERCGSRIDSAPAVDPGPSPFAAFAAFGVIVSEELRLA